MAHMKKFFKKVADRIDKLDAADRRHQFEALANEIGFLESVFNTLSEGILVIDACGMLMYSNSMAERLIVISLFRKSAAKIDIFLICRAFELIFLFFFVPFV